MEDGRRVWLDRDQVAMAQVVEVKRCEDRHDRRTGGLMSANLELVFFRAMMICVVHLLDRQPKYPLLNFFERCSPIRLRKIKC